MAVLPADVWDELWVARALVPSADSDLRRPLRRTIWRSDASLQGCALRETTAGLAEVFDVGRWKERWRFKEVTDYVDRGPESVPAAAASLSGDAGPATPSRTGPP